MHTPTEPIRPHLTESKTQINPGFTLGLLRVNWNGHSKPKVNTEWPQGVNPIRSISLKADST